MVGYEVVLAAKNEPCVGLGVVAWGCNPGLGTCDFSGAWGRGAATAHVVGRATMTAQLGRCPPVFIAACRIPSRRT